uniref:Cl9963_1 n=1 Tax=Arundo donax TaxID=35708 RepID=A0A0A9B7G9_ARUDO
MLASPLTRQTLLHGAESPQRHRLCGGSGVRMDQKAITIRQTHPGGGGGFDSRDGSHRR